MWEQENHEKVIATAVLSLSIASSSMAGGLPEPVGGASSNVAPIRQDKAVGSLCSVGSAGGMVPLLLLGLLAAAAFSGS